MRVDGRLQRERRPALDGELDTALSTVAVPRPIVETELHFLFDRARKVVRMDPARMDVERGLAAVAILVHEAELDRVPRVAIGRADDAALAGAGDRLQAPAERKVDELDVMHRDVGARIAPVDPFGELAGRD